MNEMKFGTKVAWGEDDAWTSNTRIAQRKQWYSDTTLDDQEMTALNATHIIEHRIICVLVTALCNYAEAFASDIGGNQSRYL